MSPVGKEWPPRPDRFLLGAVLHVVIGHFFVARDEPPTAEETAGIKAIREDLIQESTADYQIWKDTAVTSVTLQRESGVANSSISCEAFISQQGNYGLQSHSIGLLSKSAYDHRSRATAFQSPSGLTGYAKGSD
jgi:hypothetical protein